MRSSLNRWNLAWLALLLTAPAFGMEGTVVWSDPSCRYFIARLGEEYGMFEWRRGPDPAEGDELSGPLTAEGMIEVANITRSATNAAILVTMSGRLKVLVKSSPVQCKRRYEPS